MLLIFEKLFAKWQEGLPFSDLLRFLFVKLAISPLRGQVSTWRWWGAGAGRINKGAL